MHVIIKVCTKLRSWDWDGTNVLLFTPKFMKLMQLRHWGGSKHSFLLKERVGYKPTALNSMTLTENYVVRNSVSVMVLKTYKNLKL